MRERRPIPRKRVFWSGKGIYLGGEQSFVCSIRDWTTNGARIAVRGTPMIPKRFYLLNLTARTLHDAAVIWNNGKELGLGFAISLPFDAVDETDLAYLKRHFN